MRIPDNYECEGQLSIFDYQEPIFEIEIKGYCNDPYCTHCNYRLDGDEYKERCPSCGCLLDWKRLKEFEERERKWDSE